MSIQIRVEAPTNDVEISGAAGDWIEFADRLRLPGGTFPLRVDFPGGPGAYAAFAAALRVVVREGEIGHIRITDRNELEILGSAEMLAWLSENARGMTEADEDYHCHVDWVSFPEYLDESSSNLVFHRSAEPSLG